MTLVNNRLPSHDYLFPVLVSIVICLTVVAIVCILTHFNHGLVTGITGTLSGLLLWRLKAWKTQRKP